MSSEGLLPFIVFLLPIFLSELPGGAAAGNTQAEGLLAWRATLKSHDNISSWAVNSSGGGAAPCGWKGIVCRKGKVRGIELPNGGIAGDLSSLDFSLFRDLETIDLAGNGLTGPIPRKIANLSQLVSLQLQQNQFSGKLPGELGALGEKLLVLDLSENQLVGPIPPSLGNLSAVTRLLLHKNQIDGGIPGELGNLRNMEDLELNFNRLSGSIPPALGRLTKLSVLLLYENRLSGPIPSSLGNLTELDTLLLFNNYLSGSIPPEIGRLKKLLLLSVSTNNLTGGVPSSFKNLTSLTDLLLFENELSGALPKEMDFAAMAVVGLQRNRFFGELPAALCRGGALEHLNAAGNLFTGGLPRGLRNCSSLGRLILRENQLVGNLSEDFGVYPVLEYVDLSSNRLSGELSEKWGRCANLTMLQISGNNISGEIPPRLGDLSKLKVLDLSRNQLRGKIPEELGSGLVSLFELRLNGNELSGEVPPSIGRLTDLEILDLSENQLRGQIPAEIGNLPKLRSMDLSRNGFNGTIPTQIGKLLELQVLLDLSKNAIAGEIPQELGKLVMLETLNLSCNRLTGAIPISLRNMISLSTINLSHNFLEGPLPESDFFRRAPAAAFTDNRGLCSDGGGEQGLPPCNSISDDRGRRRRKVVLLCIFLPLSAVIFLFLPLAVYISCFRRRRGDLEEEDEGDVEAFSSADLGRGITLHQVAVATAGFDEKFCIGRGGWGSVYKVKLPGGGGGGGVTVAIKKLHAVDGDESSFKNEVRALTAIRHRNIVKLYGFYFSRRCKFLVYEYMANGSVAAVLRCDEAAAELDWAKRVRIISEVASAVAYMHHDCLPPLLHRDITGANILLDEEFKACVSDFGTAKFLKPEQSTWSATGGLAGTLGYLAPGESPPPHLDLASPLLTNLLTHSLTPLFLSLELAYTVKATTASDVYSFGVVALEILTGRHAGELIGELPSPEGKEKLLVEVLDGRLKPPTGQLASAVVVAAAAALTCLRREPAHRPTMNSVSLRLTDPRPPPLPAPLRSIRLRHLVALDEVAPIFG